MTTIRVFPRKTSITPVDDLAFVGDPPEAIPPADGIHISCVFTWDKQEAERLAVIWGQFGLSVELGGPAYKTPAREFKPGMYVKEGVTITSRGCPRRCPWCVVPEIEGDVKELGIQPGHIVQDNNLLACSDAHITKVFDMLADQRRITFPGGLDVRYLKPWHVTWLEELGSRIQEMWFAADAPYWGALERAAEMLKNFSRKKKRCYVLIAYKGESIEAAERRLLRVWDLGFLPFAQFFRGPGEQERTKEWRKFQRLWTRPAAMYSTFKNRKGTNMATKLDETIARLQNMQAFNIFAVLPDGSTQPWFEVTGGIVKDLVLHEDTLAEQVQTIAAQIMHWGRLVGQCKRVWEIAERHYRIWRDTTSLAMLDPATKPKGWKKPTGEQVKSTIRTQPEYVTHYTGMERAEEAYNAALAVLDGFRAKRDMLKAAVMRATEGSAARLSVGL